MTYLKKRSLATQILDLIFPPHCLICGKKVSSGNVCEECLSHMELLKFPLIEHKGKTYFYAVTKYEGVAASIVKLLKFKRKKCLAKDVARVISNFINENNIKAGYVGYVPMLSTEERERGFNQSYLVANALSEALDIELFNGIEKVKTTEKQVGLSRVARIKNVRNAFAVKGFVNGSIIVIDDVYTTGSTAAEINRALWKKVDGNIFFIAFSRKMD